VKLHLGVEEIPYTAQDKASGGKGTGDIAEILEAKYAIMGTFADRFGDFIAGELEQSVAKALNSILIGAPPNIDPFAGATANIEDRFKDFISKQELDGVAGVPTKAALRGVNHRLKHPYKRRAARASFVDTGLYLSSFKAWVEQ
jgi:hypothetical protein